MNKKIPVWLVVVALVSLLFMVKRCEKKEVIVKTQTKKEIVRDTIREVVLVEVPSKKKEDKKTVKATLKTKESVAELEIDIKPSTSEIIDVRGIIECPKITVEKTVTKISDRSGLFLYGKATISENFSAPELGLTYQFKNKIMVSGGFQYNHFTNNIDVKVGIGLRIW